jgi:hypothetical protein
MNRFSAAVLSSFCAMTIGGCGPRTPPPPNVPAPAMSPAQQVSPAPIPSSQATGSWNKSQVEIYLKDNLKLSEVPLSSAGGENYTGTGRGIDGQNYTLNIKQVPGGIACEFKTDTGGGRISFGNLVP